MTGRLPGERCIGCRRRLTEIGGQRVVAAGAVRVTVIGDDPPPIGRGFGPLVGLVCEGEGKTSPSFGSPPVALPALHGHRSLSPLSDSLPPCPRSRYSHR